MKFESFLILIICLFLKKRDEANAMTGNFQMKNFVVFYGVSNVTKEETKTLVNLIASPVVANTTNDPNNDMLESKTVILNYSIVNIAEPENFTKIPLKSNFSIDYFENLLQTYDTINKNTTKLSWKKVGNFLRKCPEFSGVSIITNLKPADSDLLPEIIQLIKNRSLEVLVSPFNSSTIESYYFGYRYFSPKDPEFISEEYQKINKIKYDLNEASFVKRILNEFVTINCKTDQCDTSVVMIFDWFSLLQLIGFHSSLQHSLNLFAKELYSNQLIYSYQGHSTRIRKLFIVCSYTDQPEIPVKEIDLSISHDFEYFDDMISNLGNINDTSRFSMKSLIKGLDLSSPNGIVYLFAGTQPQHTELMPAALKLIKDKKITVEVAYVRTKNYKKPDIEYQQINEASFKNRPTFV